jgi:hypothetical protein
VRDSGQGGCEGVGHNKHACYLPSGRTAAYKHPAAWTAAVVVNGVIYILEGGLLFGMGDLLSCMRLIRRRGIKLESEESGL